MTITDLRLQQFRSYKDASYTLGPHVNIVVGPNASGKTNLLEAVLVAARGGSYRAKDSDLLHFEADWARIDAGLTDTTRVVKLQRADGGKVVKSFTIDSHILSRLSAERTLPVVLFEPDHLQLLSGSPELRRQFLDDLLEQALPGFGMTRRHYKRVLAQRNSLLKHNPRDIVEQLFVWNIRLSELGAVIARERALLVERFMERVSDVYVRLAGGTQRIGLSYKSSFALPNYETEFLRKLEASTELDVLRGFTAHGPHREDLEVFMDDHLVQETASRGETRTLVLALKIMEATLLEELRQKRPLVLLDDVFSELDSKRRRALTHFLTDYQTIITTTDADVVMKHVQDSVTIALGKTT